MGGANLSSGLGSLCGWLQSPKAAAAALDDAAPVSLYFTTAVTFL